MISWTNLLTRCHSASCLFSAVFGSRKSENEYSRNWTGQKPKSLFSRKIHRARRRDQGGPQGGQTTPRRGSPRPRQGMVWAPWLPTDLASSPIRCLLMQKPKIIKPPATKSSAAPPPPKGRFGGQKVSVPAPCRDREVSPEPSPSISTAISIDLHRHLHHRC